MIPPGILTINKPPGITSFTMLGPLKRLLGTRKIGHAGTLDKFASGLMIVAVGQGTKFVQFLSGQDKRYRARFRFGSETSTLDPEGEVIAEAEIPAENQILSALEAFRGKISQVPPEYSAVHVDGKRAYQRSLSGEQFDIPPREVDISRFELLSYTDGCGEFLIDCSKGTYIRSLARDLGKACGSRAHVVELTRERIGQFHLNQATGFDSLGTMSREQIIEKMVSGAELIELIPGISPWKVSDDISRRIRNGKPLASSELPAELEANEGVIAALQADGQLAALFEHGPKGLSYISVFHTLDMDGTYVDNFES